MNSIAEEIYGCLNNNKDSFGYYHRKITIYHE